MIRKFVWYSSKKEDLGSRLCLHILKQEPPLFHVCFHCSRTSYSCSWICLRCFREGFTAPLILCYYPWFREKSLWTRAASLPGSRLSFQGSMKCVCRSNVTIFCLRMTSTAPRWPISPPPPPAREDVFQGYRNNFLDWPFLSWVRPNGFQVIVCVCSEFSRCHRLNLLLFLDWYSQSELTQLHGGPPLLGGERPFESNFSGPGD